MPTYDYECLKCGKISEAFHKVNGPPLKECPYCKGKVKRLISSGSGLIFKGSGFYATDYKKKKGPHADSQTKSTTKKGSKD
ncbi:MAG: zinc ribbon domain-containing protein [Candidatus Omnitrophica bacterium]|nr:zinc ribbon domain-containing protein [Candidatus Omnitrophota bacterium]